MKRFAIILITMALIFSTCITPLYASTPELENQTPKKVILYLKPDVAVEVNGARQLFKDVNNQNVYPVFYNGMAYLPVRAVSAIMKEPIEWDKGSKTIFIGKTLAYPVKSTAPIPTNSAIEANSNEVEALKGIEPSLVNGYSKPDVLIMYDFEIQSFKDSDGITIYPLNYNGTTYLPIRAISNLMNVPIEWDGTAKKISLGDGENPVAEEPATEVKKADKAAYLLEDLYDREEALYYEASAKITNIRNATAEEKQTIATSSSDNYLKAQSLTQEVKDLNQRSFTQSEKDSYDKLLEFAESNEYYILIIENIAYLAASDSDYSMMADTFLYFALDAQAKMEDAGKLIIKDPVY